MKKFWFSILLAGLTLVLLGLIFSFPQKRLTISPADQFPIQAPATRLLGLLEAHKTSGALMFSKNGSVLLEQYWGKSDLRLGQKNTKETLFNIGSIAKQFTGFLAILLESEQRLAGASKVEDFLLETQGTAVGSIQIKHLLSMRSGLPYIEPWPTKLRSQLFNLNWTQEEAIREITKYSISFDPGANFQYSNIGYTLLSLIISRIDGKPFSKVLEERIFSPFGMSNTYLDIGRKSEEVLATGYFAILERLFPMPNWNYSLLQGAGGVVSNVSDLSRWAAALTRRSREDLRFRSRLFGHASVEIYNYGWSLTKSGLLRHSGETPGFCSYIAISESGGFGAYTLNTDICLSEAVKEIEAALDAVVAGL